MLRCGVAEVVITPQISVEIAGWHAGRSAGTLHELKAQVIVLDDGDSRCAIVAVDIIGLAGDEVKRLQEEMLEKFNIRLAMLNASHTHSGPAGHDFRGTWGKADAGYLSFLRSRLMLGVKEASASMFDAAITVGSCLAPGLTYCSPTRNPGGKAEDRVTLACIKDSRGVPRAALVAFACHPVCLHGYQQMLSPDFIEYLRRRMQYDVGPGVLIAFLSAAGGDIMPAGFEGAGKGTPELAQRIGNGIAEHALSLWDDAEPLNVDRIGHAIGAVDLPLLPMPRPAELSERIRQYKQKLQERNLSFSERDELEATLDWAEQAVATQSERTQPPATFRAMLTALALGDWALVGMPFEVYACIGQEMARRSAFKHTTILGQTNGSFGYLVNRAAHEMSSYTVTHASVRYGLRTFAPHAADVVVDRAALLLEAVKKTNDRTVD